MKKLLAGLCAFVLALSMFGCGDEEVKKVCAKCKKTHTGDCAKVEKKDDATKKTDE